MDEEDAGISGFTKHLEYHPMVNGRAHTLGSSDNRILNATFKRTYEKFLTTKVQKPHLTNEEKLEFVYYL